MRKGGVDVELFCGWILCRDHDLRRLKCPVSPLPRPCARVSEALAGDSEAQPRDNSTTPTRFLAGESAYRQKIVYYCGILIIFYLRGQIYQCNSLLISQRVIIAEVRESVYLGGA